MKDKINIEFVMDQKMCNECKKSGEEYYELKLQLRFLFFEDLEKIKEEISQLIFKHLNAVNKVDELEQGLDYYFRNLGMVNKISRLFNKRYLCETKRTKKIVGHNFLESKDIWRHTILIKIINLSVRDVVSIKGEEYYIKAFNKSDLVLRRMDNGAKKVVTFNIVKEYLNLVRKADIKDKDKNKDKGKVEDQEESDEDEFLIDKSD